MSDYERRIILNLSKEGTAAKPLATTGVKHDQGKPDLSLLSPYAIEAMGRVMTFGAKKYSPNNWRGGFPYTRLLAAAFRHLNSYQKGEAKDPETGESHIAHALCCLMMLSEFEVTRPELNDVYHQVKNNESN